MAYNSKLFWEIFYEKMKKLQNFIDNFFNSR